MAHNGLSLFLVIYMSEDLGFTDFQIGYHIALLTLLGVASAPAIGWASDKFGRRRIIFISLLKLLMGSLFASGDTYRWFIPFVDYFVTNFDNPWEYFYNLGENMIFPYGPVMLYPLALVTLILSPLTFIFGDSLPLIAFSITLLIFFFIFKKVLMIN